MFGDLRKPFENLRETLTCSEIWWMLLGGTYRFLMLAQVINVITVAIRAIHKPTTITLKYTLCLKGDCVVQEHGGRHWPISLSGIRGELHLIEKSVLWRRKINYRIFFLISWLHSAGRSLLDTATVWGLPLIEAVRFLLHKLDELTDLNASVLWKKWTSVTLISINRITYLQVSLH